MKFHLSLKDKSKYALFILPIIYCLLSFYCYYLIRPFFSCYPDSIYIYLINGTNIADGNFDIGHYDNPGTPEHLLAGLFIFITHFFIDKNTVISESVLANPELYLGVNVIVVSILLFISVYASGKIIYKNTGNITAALLFQLIPISSSFGIQSLLVVCIVPENIILICITFYYTYLWVLCNTRNEFPDDPVSKKNHIVFFSFFTALLVISKITCLPLLIIPFFLIKKNLHKLLFLVFTIVFAWLLLFPAWGHLDDIFSWFEKLATHSGKYGQGEKELFNPIAFFNNIWLLLRHEIFFFVVYCVSFIAIITGIIRKKWRNNFYKLILACWIIMTAQVFFAAKQFGYHYLLASQSIAIPVLMATTVLFFPTKTQKYITYVVLLICFSWFTFQTAKRLDGYSGDNKIHESINFAKKFNNIPKIITTGYQGSCFPESALRFGAAYGGPRFHYSNYILKKLYPNSFFYDLHLTDNKVNWWDISYSPLEFFQNHRQAIIYFKSMDEESEMKMIKKLVNGFEKSVKEIKMLEYNSATNERFYSIVIDENKLNLSYNEIEKIDFDFDTLTKDKSLFTSENKKNTISGAEFKTAEKSFSGNNSILIPQGVNVCCTTLVVSPGDLLDISLKCNSTDIPAGIAISTPVNPSIFNKKSEAIVGDLGNDWKKINLHTIIPLNCRERNMNFYLFYRGKKKCYIDDLDITIFKNNALIPPDSTFNITGKRFVLKTSNNKFLSIGKDNSITAISKEMLDAGIFEAIDMGNGKIALKTLEGKYVSADRNQNNILLANRNNAYEWETFEVKMISANYLTLKSSNGNFVGFLDNKMNIIGANNQRQEIFEYIKIK